MIAVVWRLVKPRNDVVYYVALILFRVRETACDSSGK